MKITWGCHAGFSFQMDMVWIYSLHTLKLLQSDLLCMNRSEFHPTLLQKLQKPRFFCHSTSPEHAKKILQQGYLPKGTFVTVNRVNNFGQVPLIFRINYAKNKKTLSQLFNEDLCMEGSDQMKWEWENHDQLILKEPVDFMENATLLSKNEIKKLFKKPTSS